MSIARRRSLLFSGIGVIIAAVITAQAPAPALRSDWYTKGTTEKMAEFGGCPQNSAPHEYEPR